MKKIIALVGLCGSGKSIVCDHLIKSYSKVYFGGLTMEKLKEEGLDVNETNEKMMREKLRKEHGMAAYAIIAMPKIEKLISEEKDVLIDGLYSWSEYKILKEKFPNMITIAVFTPLHLRYSRLAKRKVRPLTKEEIDGRDQSEIENIEKGGPIAKADYTLVNDDSYEQLISKVEEVLKNVGA